jgi:hypothetical protein
MSTCSYDGPYEPCTLRAREHVITRAGVVGPLCGYHAGQVTLRRRDYAVLSVWHTDPVLDRAGADWLSDIVTERLEHHLGQLPVAVEYAVVYRALCGDGQQASGAVYPTGQGAVATMGLLADLAPDVAGRIEGGACDE